MSFRKLLICAAAVLGVVLGGGAASASGSGSDAGRTGTAVVVQADATPSGTDGGPACTSCWG